MYYVWCIICAVRSRHASYFATRRSYHHNIINPKKQYIRQKTERNKGGQSFTNRCKMNTMNDYGNDEMEAFPQRLHKMLGEMEVQGKDHIISWNPDGRSFTIRKPKEFAETIMVQYFKNQTRYKSFQVRTINALAMELERTNSAAHPILNFLFRSFFLLQRQLNLYRFKRDSQGKTKGVCKLS